MSFDIRNLYQVWSQYHYSIKRKTPVLTEVEIPISLHSPKYYWQLSSRCLTTMNTKWTAKKMFLHMKPTRTFTSWMRCFVLPPWRLSTLTLKAKEKPLRQQGCSNHNSMIFGFKCTTDQGQFLSLFYLYLFSLQHGNMGTDHKKTGLWIGLEIAFLTLFSYEKSRFSHFPFQESTF